MHDFKMTQAHGHTDTYIDGHKHTHTHTQTCIHIQITQMQSYIKTVCQSLWVTNYIR